MKSKLLKRVLMVVFVILVLVSGLLAMVAHVDLKDKYSPIDAKTSIFPSLTEVKVDFKHQFNLKKSLPMMGSAIIDIDADGVEEIFIGGGLNQPDGLMKYSNGKFVNISTPEILPLHPDKATYGVAVIDADKDGLNDMYICKDGGIYYYKNMRGKFKSQKLTLVFNEKSQPVSITLGDINNDGILDMFVSTYLFKNLMEGQTIFTKPNYGSTSELFIGKGNNEFQSITKSAGLNYVHNTFQAVLIDVDLDGFLDLVVAHDTGEVRTYKNNGNSTFRMVENPTTNRYAYPMGIAVGDYNNDTRPDFFFSNTGSTVPESFAKGDLNKEQAARLNLKWIMLKNNGGFKFTDAAKETQLADYEFSWGAVLQDFNLDGLQDLVVSENYIDLIFNKFYMLPGRFLLQTDKGVFKNIEKEIGVDNKNYAITPLVADFNNDGYPDLVHVNLNGTLRIFISKNIGNNFVKVKLPNTVDYMGTTVTVETETGKKYTDFMISGEGLCSDQSHILMFGIGAERSIKSITVTKVGRKVDVIKSPLINSLVKI